MKNAKSSFSTLAIHAGYEADPITGAVVPPIYLASTYQLEKLGVMRKFEYGRTGNANRLSLEKNISALEGGKYGYAYASGLSAISAVMHLLKPGDHILVSENIYGGTFNLFVKEFQNFNLDFTFVDSSEAENIERAARPNTKMLFIETPTNPLLILTDLEKTAKISKKRKWILVVDNTFMTPYWQNPLALGADIVVHSSSKFLNGHSDSIGGIAITSSAKYAERLNFIQKSVGAILSPFDSWLVLRGVKTLAVRMKAHEENAKEIAKFLASHPKVKKVHYPGFKTHPQHNLAKRQMRGFGAVIAFDLGSKKNAGKFLNALRVCTLATSLGGVETLISHSATMTHGSVPPEERRRLGITEGTIRISVGIEDAKDIKNDIAQALKKL